MELCWRALKKRVDATASVLATILHTSHVGIAISGGLNLVVAELACGVTGLTFVPLEPKLPPARLQYLVKEANIGCIVMEGSPVAFRDAFGEACPPLQGDRICTLHTLTTPF